MSQEVVEVDGRVVEALPNALFRVELDTVQRPRLTVHLGTQALLRVRPGDAVVVALSPLDEGRGRIVRRKE